MISPTRENFKIFPFKQCYGLLFLNILQVSQKMHSYEGPALPKLREGGGQFTSNVRGQAGGNTFMGVDLAYKKSVCTYL